MGMTLSAQEKEPSFELEGNKVKVTYFHENGVVAQTGSYLNGKLDGEWTMFDANGNKIVTGEYTMGKKTGKWFFWEASNLKEVDFENSKIVSVTTWNQNAGVAMNK
jgi:antitoxin component YwqK of YwqJK toxin-antitoxin module